MSKIAHQIAHQIAHRAMCKNCTRLYSAANAAEMKLETLSNLILETSLKSKTPNSRTGKKTTILVNEEIVWILETNFFLNRTNGSLQDA